MAIALSLALTPPALGLERLFYTAQERAQLEQMRIQQQQAPQTRQQLPPPPPEVRVDGIVLRSSGQRYAWINGKMALAQEGIVADLANAQGTEVPIVILAGSGVAGSGADNSGADGGQKVRLKPGQSINTRTNVISESYQQPSPAAPPAVPATASTSNDNNADKGLVDLFLDLTRLESNAPPTKPSTD